MPVLPAPTTWRAVVRAVLVAAVAVLPVAGCSQPFDDRAKQQCVSAIRSEHGRVGSMYVSSVDVQQPDQTAVVTGRWDYTSVESDLDPNGSRVQWEEDHSAGWTCVVDGRQVSYAFDDAPATPADTPLVGHLFGDPAEPAPTGRNFITGEGLPAEAVPDACLIKGNVAFSTGERIYHMPGQEFYDETVINEDYGETWFCTEEDAVAAGWRKARS